MQSPRRLSSRRLPVIRGLWEMLRRSPRDCLQSGARRAQSRFNSNVRFDHSLGGTGARTAFLDYANALVCLATDHFVPVLEFVGSTNTISSRTELIVQPEVIVRHGLHWELKAGLQLGLNSLTPPVGVRARNSRGLGGSATKSVPNAPW